MQFKPFCAVQRARRSCSDGTKRYVPPRMHCLHPPFSLKGFSASFKLNRHLFVSLPGRTAGKTGDKSKAKALKAAKAVKRSTWRQSRKPRYSTVFHRPKTFEAPRKPKFPRLRYICTTVLGGWKCRHGLCSDGSILAEPSVLVILPHYKQKDAFALVLTKRWLVWSVKTRQQLSPV